MKIGDPVIYLDDQGVSHNALLTRVPMKEDSVVENGQVDLVYIIQDPAVHEEVLSGKAQQTGTAAGTTGVTQSDPGSKEEQNKTTRQHVDDKQAADDAAATKKYEKERATSGAAASEKKTGKKTPTGQTKTVMESLVDYAYDVPHMPGPGSYGPHWRRLTEQN